MLVAAWSCLMYVAVRNCSWHEVTDFWMNIVSTCDALQSSTPDASSFRIDPATRQLMDSFARAEQGDTLLNRATPPVPDLPALSK